MKITCANFPMIQADFSELGVKRKNRCQIDRSNENDGAGRTRSTAAVNVTGGPCDRRPM